MSLNPGQVAELRSVQHVAGLMGEDVVYSLTIRDPRTIARIRELTFLKAAPAWLAIEDMTTSLTIATPYPEWFAALETEVTNASAAR